MLDAVIAIVANGRRFVRRAASGERGANAIGRR